MTAIRPLALAKQLAAIPFHFVQHQWKGIAASKPEKHTFGPHSRPIKNGSHLDSLRFALNDPLTADVVDQWLNTLGK